MNTKKITSTAMMAVITSLVLVSGMNSVFAHTFNNWSSATHEYYCTSSLNNIPHTSNVSPCGDLASSANVWNNANSSWDLTRAVTWNSAVSSVFGTNLGQDVAGFMSPYSSTPNPFTSAYVAFNTHSSVKYADSFVETGSNYIDYRSTSGHELGHLAGIDHNASTLSVMYASLTWNELNRLPNSHDKSELGGLYP